MQSWPRRPTDRAGPHLRFLPENEHDRPKLSVGIGQDDGERHRVPGYLPAELRRVNYAAVDGIRIDIERPPDDKPPLGVDDDSPFGVAKGAADVYVR